MNGKDHDIESVKNELPKTYKAILKYIKAIKEVESQGLSYHMTMNLDSAPDFVAALNNRILSITNKILKFQGLSEAQTFTSVEQAIENFGVTTTLYDTVLEKVDDKLNLLLKNNSENTSNSKPSEAPETLLTQLSLPEDGSGSKYSMVLSRNQLRPQNLFPEKVDNGYNTPFVSRLYRVGSKPNAKKPISPELLNKFKEVSIDQITIDMAANLPHPYKFEIENLEYSDICFVKSEPAEPKNLEDTQLHMVSDQASLTSMIENLKEQSVIAVDLEAHDYRSFFGFVCLMQISSYDADYIIDTLALRNELLELNTVFTDPKILKVFHGADNDITWLQRDFGLYVVNVFDTYQACKTLTLPKGSLAFLLDHYLKIKANKQYQLADWRVRPIPNEMIDYARSDTHYLLYIFECLRNQLIDDSTTLDHNKVRAVLDMSQHVASQIYVRPTYDSDNGEGPGGWAKLLENFSLPLSPQQVETFRQLHAWRDMKAREEDESVRYIIPNHMLFNLAFKMPTTTAGVLGCCEPQPLAVRMGAHSLAQLIADIPIGGGGVVAPLGKSAQKPKTKVSSIKTEESDSGLDKSRIISLPISTELKGKSSLGELVSKFKEPNSVASQDSKLFGALFFESDDVKPDQSQLEIRNAMRDQILASMDFCPIPSTIQVEALVEDSRVDSNLQAVSETAAPEGHEYNMDRVIPKDSMVILSGKSKHGSRAQDIDELLAEADDNKPKKKKKTNDQDTKPDIADHNYGNSQSVADRLTSAPVREKKKPKKKNQQQADPSEAPEEPFDPFGEEMAGNRHYHPKSITTKPNKGNHRPHKK